MKLVQMFALLLCLISLGWAQANTPPVQLPPGTALYDDFGRNWLDPARWQATPSGTEACYFSSNVLECVREIKDGKLRLAVKSFGATDSNEGTQYGESKLVFVQPFTSLTADVIVRNTSSRGCSTNTTDSWAQAMFTARFFNSGTGDPNDDVDAHITFAHASLDNPGALDVEGFLFWQGQYFGFAKVGSVQIGTPIRASLQWIPSSHKFTASYENLTTHQHFFADVPYSMSDTTPPTGYWNVLYVQVFPANCLGHQTSSEMEATFDNVVIKP